MARQPSLQLLLTPELLLLSHVKITSVTGPSPSPLGAVSRWVTMSPLACDKCQWEHCVPVGLVLAGSRGVELSPWTPVIYCSAFSLGLDRAGKSFSPQSAIYTPGGSAPRVCGVFVTGTEQHEDPVLWNVLRKNVGKDALRVCGKTRETRGKYLGETPVVFR